MPQQFLTNASGEVAILRWEKTVETESLNVKDSRRNTNSFLEEPDSGFLWEIQGSSADKWVKWVGSEMRSDKKTGSLVGRCATERTMKGI